MLFGGADGSELELRDARGKSRTIRGKFPYGRLAVLSDGGKNGRPRKEQFAPQAFAYRIDKTDEDLHLLAGHSYDRPLASRSADTFDVKDTPEAVRAVIKRIARLIPGRRKSEDEALAIVATMVGALTLARAVDDPELSDRILAAARTRLASR